MRNIKIVIEYEGTAYHGWQRQKNGLSIQEILEDKIAVITNENIKITGAGRTDAGVHALNQVANFRTTSGIEEKNLLDGINSLLPRDVAVKSLTEVDEHFHARRDAKSKVYRYQICNRRVRPVLLRNFCWAIYAPLDIEKMKEGALLLKGTHDFTSFCTIHTDAPDRIRHICDIDVTSDERGMVQLHIEADGFLRYMVRIITGTLVDVGRAKRTPTDLRALLEAKDRNRGGMTAPSQGLCLMEVKY